MFHYSTDSAKNGKRKHNVLKMRLVEEAIIYRYFHAAQYNR